MPRTSFEAEFAARYAVEKEKLPAPEFLTQEQQGLWDRTCADLPAGFIRSDSMPVMVELVRAMGLSAQIAETLDAMRTASLTGTDREGRAQRSLFIRLLREAREQARLIATLSTKLRFTPQSTSRVRDVARERARTVTGPRPWEVIPGRVRDDVDDGGADGDDGGQGPAAN